jgi:hypothetical protein
MGGSTLQAPELLTEAPGHERALRFRDLLPIGTVLAIGVGRRCEPADRHPPRPLNRAIGRVGHERILTRRVRSCTTTSLTQTACSSASLPPSALRATTGKLRIHVERFNPALRLYERLGFRQIEDRDVYLFME